MSIRQSGSAFVKNNGSILLFLLTVLLCALAGEVTLAYIYKAGEQGPFSHRVFDPVLQHVMPPNVLDEIDDYGFRNKDGEKEYKIVAIGDSYTYGYYADYHETWPKRLSEKTGFSIYNSGLGGYGIPQYLRLTEMSMRLRPEIILVAIYLGNDFYDTCRVIGSLEYWNRYFTDRNIDVSLCENRGAKQNIDRFREKSGEKGSGAEIGKFDYLVYWASERLRLAGWRMAVSRLPYFIKKREKEKTEAMLKRQPGRYFRFEDEKIGTVFFPGFFPDRKRMTKLEQGYKHGLYLIERMKRVAKDNNVKLAAVIIPTKLNAYFDHMIKEGVALPESLRFSVREERALSEKLEADLSRLDIPFVETLPYLKAKIANRVMLFLRTEDYHPAPAGYEVYADAAADLLGEIDKRKREK